LTAVLVVTVCMRIDGLTFQTAIYGDNFGTAACSSFALIFRNLARVAAINLVRYPFHGSVLR